MYVEVEYLYVIGEWNEEGLFHSRFSEGCVLLQFIFAYDQVVEVLLDKDAIYCHIVREVFLRFSFNYRSDYHDYVTLDRERLL